MKPLGVLPALYQPAGRKWRERGPSFPFVSITNQGGIQKTMYLDNADDRPFPMDRRSWFFTCRCRRCVSQEWDTELMGLRCLVAMCGGAVPPSGSGGKGRPLSTHYHPRKTGKVGLLLPPKSILPLLVRRERAKVATESGARSCACVDQP